MRAERESRHLVLKATVGLAILFLWFPLVLIVLYAFTTDDVVPTFPPPGLTTKWFGIARDNPEIWEAMWLSTVSRCWPLRSPSSWAAWWPLRSLVHASSGVRRSHS